MGLQDQASACGSTGGLGEQFIETLSTAAGVSASGEIVCFSRPVCRISSGPRSDRWTDLGIPEEREPNAAARLGGLVG